MKSYNKKVLIALMKIISISYVLLMSTGFIYILTNITEENSSNFIVKPNDLSFLLNGNQSDVKEAKEEVEKVSVNNENKGENEREEEVRIIISKKDEYQNKIFNNSTYTDYAVCVLTNCTTENNIKYTDNPPCEKERSYSFYPLVFVLGAFCSHKKLLRMGII